jgi:hypothetical protein
MAAYGTGDQVADQGTVAGLPNFVGELFKLSPLDTPLLTLVGGKSGGRPTAAPVFTWQDTIHRAPDRTFGGTVITEGADANFASQKRNERRNVVQIFQYGVELSYLKQGSVDLLGAENIAMVGPPTADVTTYATSILGNQPVPSEMAWQLQVKIEQCALDVEDAFLNGTYAYPVDLFTTGPATQGIVGAISADTSQDASANDIGQTTGDTAEERAGNVISILAKKLYDNGAPMRNCVLMGNSQSKKDTGRYYTTTATGGSIQPRSYNIFGVNVTDIETEFGMFPFVLNRHLSVDEVLIIDLDVMAPRFEPVPNKGHFFLEPLSKLGSYDREQLYGQIGLEYGPGGWHAKATAWTTATVA